jgi:hypothetical protein
MNDCFCHRHMPVALGTAWPLSTYDAVTGQEPPFKNFPESGQSMRQENWQKLSEMPKVSSPCADKLVFNQENPVCPALFQVSRRLLLLKHLDRLRLILMATMMAAEPQQQSLLRHSLKCQNPRLLWATM